MVGKTVALEKELSDELTCSPRKTSVISRAPCRYALKIGLAAIENPELTIGEIKDIFEAAVDRQAGRVSELSLDQI